MRLLHLCCWIGAAALAFTLAGCGGGPDLGPPKDGTGYVPAEMPPAPAVAPASKTKNK
jgi:hypothetical protein